MADGIAVVESLVRELLVEQIPDLRVDRVERIDEGGARTFSINEDLIVRFAVDEADSAKLKREVVLLGELAPKLAVAVPVPEFVGQPSDVYPFAFVVYRKIAGLSGETERPARERWPAIAAQFGAFLSALHAYPVPRARGHGVPKAPSSCFGAEYRTRDAGTLLRRVQDAGSVIQKELPDIVDDRTQPYLSGRVALPPASPLAPVLCHADLKGEHFIVAEGAEAVVGVIDWSAFCVTDPLLDFTGLMIWLGEAFVRQVLTHYTEPVDEHFLERVCFYARCFSLDNLAWRLTTDWAAPLELLKTQAHWAFSR